MSGLRPLFMSLCFFYEDFMANATILDFLKCIASLDFSNKLF